MNSCYYCDSKAVSKCECASVYICKQHRAEHYSSNRIHLLKEIKITMFPEVQKEFDKCAMERIGIIEKCKMKIVTNTEMIIKQINELKKNALDKLEREKIELEQLFRRQEFNINDMERIEKILDYEGVEAELHSLSLSESQILYFGRNFLLEISRKDKIVDNSFNKTTRELFKTLGPFVYKKSIFDSVRRLKKLPVTLLNESVYYGEWSVSGERHGFGMEFSVDGSIYEGEWNHGQCCGNGRMIHAVGDYYEGQWEDDRANGYGTYVRIEGDKYEGYWENDRQHGAGKEIWPDGAIYEGEFRNGLKEGKGKFKWSDGSSYDGNFNSNLFSGFGIYNWSDGRRYEGMWENNKMNGKGKMIMTDGTKYEGEHLNDLKHGYGVFEWPDRKKYEGQFFGGKQHGKGIFTNVDGTTCEQEWSNGKIVMKL